MDPILARVSALNSEYHARLAHLRASVPPQVETPEWYRITNNVEGDTATVMLYGMIGGWYGVDSESFVTELRGISASQIDLRINSGGGSIFEGAAIYTAIRNHTAKVTAYVDGLAASAASFIAMAADRVVMSPAATMMIHDGSGITMGNRDDHITTANLLDKLSGTIAALYAKRAGGTTDEWREHMLADRGAGTWYTAQEAVDAGLADEVDGAEDTPEDKAVPPVAAVVPNPTTTTDPPETNDTPESEAAPAFDMDLFARALLASALKE